MYQPEQRLIVDQVPFNLDNSARRSYVHASGDGTEQVSGQPGAEKRFGTAQLCVHPGPRHNNYLVSVEITYGPEYDWWVMCVCVCTCAFQASVRSPS